MTKYTVNNKFYFTLCSIHNELNEIFNIIKKINPQIFNSKEDLFNEILKEIEFGNELILVANEMGQKMEDALRNKNEWGPTDHLMVFQNPFIEEEE
jgi:hypothetical protein